MINENVITVTPLKESVLPALFLPIVPGWRQGLEAKIALNFYMVSPY